MRTIDADTLVSDFLVTIPANNILCKRYVSMEQIQNAPTIEPERMKFVQEAVNTLMNTSKTNSIKDKCFRNAARLVQNAIDGEPQDFELIPDEPERKWIPVSKKKPKVYEDVLVARVEGITVGSLTPYGCWLVDCSDQECDDIKAWMPLPKPFKEADE